MGGYLAEQIKKKYDKPVRTVEDRYIPTKMILMS
jgi:hypothetical protein